MTILYIDVSNIDHNYTNVYLAILMKYFLKKKIVIGL